MNYLATYLVMDFGNISETTFRGEFSKINLSKIFPLMVQKVKISTSQNTYVCIEDFSSH